LNIARKVFTGLIFARCHRYVEDNTRSKWSSARGHPAQVRGRLDDDNGGIFERSMIFFKMVIWWL
jgi:hypothetical protein